MGGKATTPYCAFSDHPWTHRSRPVGVGLFRQSRTLGGVAAATCVFRHGGFSRKNGNNDPDGLRMPSPIVTHPLNPFGG